MALLYEELTGKLTRLLFDVYNELGFGYQEYIYQRAYETALHEAGFSFEREKYMKANYLRIGILALFTRDGVKIKRLIN